MAKKKDPSKIASVMTGSCAHLGIDARVREHQIKKTWKDAVGELIAEKSRPTRLMGSTLYCTVSSAPWMSELTYQKPVIMAKLNELLGTGAITEIIFKPGNPVVDAPKAMPMPRRMLTEEEKKEIEETVAPVKDEKLKALIKRAMEKAKT